ncbi:MAG: hypothetical protein IMY72_12045 [Bacteroidetes bacterium]|nr:hypothetical protein [Bacteroidota bacterium]
MIFFTKKNVLFLSLFVSLSFYSCESINPDEDIPGYIQIDKISVSNDSKSLNLTDAWINIDGNLLGIYELPAKFPVLSHGRHNIMVRAGIKVNGIAASRSFYPFFNSYQIDTIIQAEKTINLNPILQYHDNVNFILSENFEGNGSSLETIEKSDATISFVNSNVFDGNFSAGIFLNEDDTLFECQTIDAFRLPNDRSPIFFEMNYKNNNKFYVGLLIYTQSKIIHNPIIIINESENWNKIFIDLANTVNDYPEAYKFRLFIGAINNNKQNTELYLDNLKLLTYKNE